MEKQTNDFLTFKENIIPCLSFKKQYFNNTKISSCIIAPDNGFEDKLELEIETLKNVSCLVNLWTDEKLSASKRITQYDMEIMNAAYTLYNSGYKIFTIDMLAHVLSGNDKQNVTDKKRKKIKKSIEKLQLIRISIDCTEEYNKRLKNPKDKLAKYIYDDYLLPTQKVTAQYTANGKLTTAYIICNKPVLFEYAEFTHQIIDLPAYLLNTQDYFKDSDEAILLKRLVIKRILLIKSKNKLDSNKLSLYWRDSAGKMGGLFASLDYEPIQTRQWAKKKENLLYVVKGTLQSLVDKGLIRGFEPYRKDDSTNPSVPITGYRIYV